jgi:uncharacterized protein YdcH (DUF465 family)
MIDGIILTRIEDLDDKIDRLSYSIQDGLNAGVTDTEKMIKKLEFELRRDELIEVINENDRNENAARIRELKK